MKRLICVILLLPLLCGCGNAGGDKLEYVKSIITYGHSFTVSAGKSEFTLYDCSQASFEHKNGMIILMNDNGCTVTFDGITSSVPCKPFEYMITFQRALMLIAENPQLLKAESTMASASVDGMNVYIDNINKIEKITINKGGNTTEYTVDAII